ncbi:GNAT family N-acetyltransferase [Rhodobacter sp. NTK016B]|uniref:GNAT family N-acetyltransferase n=1 Tax=Rhodobacter sp. NTK016B TaxID=2759676 RepID=UPI001A8F1A3F|nr:GNAT family protein [Rhodobacter sp. NTK016B]MBN8294543.1 GNAT family N-acetyltransferase [Rhodobacter sp. NTK016B]
MTLRVTMTDPEKLAAWAEARMGVDKGCLPPETICLGILDGNEIKAVVSFNAFYSRYAAMHIASDSSRSWLTPKILRTVSRFAFDHLGLTRLNCTVPLHNKRAMVLAIKIGAVPTGLLENGADDGSDAALFSVTPNRCPWLPTKKEPDDGQVRTKS